MPFIGGLNLRSSRQLSQKYRSGNMVARGNILDGDILEHFFSLTHTLKGHVTRESETEESALKSIIPY